MRRELLIFTLTLGLAASVNLPEITTYAKVTKNGEETIKNHQDGGPLIWLIKNFSAPNNTKDEITQGRSSQGVSITVSPVYVPPKIPELHKGEAVDYPTTKSYSTLDEEMLARLDGKTGRKQAQDRFHPPASFEHAIAHGNGAKLKQAPSSSSSQSSPSSSSASYPSGPPADLSQGSDTGPRYPSPVFPGTYDYRPPSFLNAKPMSTDSYSPPDSFPKAPSSFDSSAISYGPSPDSYGPPSDYPSHESDHDNDHRELDPEISSEIHVSDYGSKPVYTPPKSIEYAGHFDRPAFVDDPYIHDHGHDHDYGHDIIYDHLPEDHTTPAPEMMDQRLSKKPYSYYFIGKKLWYIPLYFSIYFIIYISALILKSISRHKINFPSTLAAAVDHNRRSKRSIDSFEWLDLTIKVIEGIEKVKKAFEKRT